MLFVDNITLFFLDVGTHGDFIILVHVLSNATLVYCLKELAMSVFSNFLLLTN